MSSYMVDPLILSMAFRKLTPVDKDIDRQARLKIVFLDQALVLIRADREHSAEVVVPADGTGSGSICVEWIKLVSIFKNGVAKQPVKLSYEDGDPHLAINQKIIRMKVPVLIGDVRIAYAFSDDALEYSLEPEQAVAFFRSLEITSVFCTNKIVGRGKFAGVVVHANRLVGASHDGVFIGRSGVATPDYFGLPYGVVWSLLAYAGSENMSVTVGAGAVTPGKIRAVFFSGTSDGLAWTLRFPFIRPAHSSLGLDLTKVVEPKSGQFGFNVEAQHLKDSFISASSIQGKSDVWVDLLGVTETGLSVRASDVENITEAHNFAEISEFRGEFVGLQVKKASVLGLLSHLTGLLQVSFDRATSVLAIQNGEGLALLACNMKEGD